MSDPTTPTTTTVGVTVLPGGLTMHTSGGRLTEWFLTAAFTVISLIAYEKMFFGDATSGNTKSDSAARWGTAGISIALAFSVLAVLSNIYIRDKFVGTSNEAGALLMVCGFWAAVLPTIMDPGNRLATSLSGIRNANLYFFSWGSFIMSFLTLSKYLSDVQGYDPKKSLTTIGAFTLTSFVTMTSAIRVWKAIDCSYWQGSSVACDRTAFAISLGCISSVMAATWIVLTTHYLTEKTSNYFKAIVGLLLIVLWSFGIAYITFGGRSPGVTIGNLYFFTWASFALALALFIDGLKDLLELIQPPAREASAANDTEIRKQQDSAESDS